jgi:hypothetical protein
MRRSRRAKVIAAAALLMLCWLVFARYLYGWRADGWWEENTGPFTLLLPQDMRGGPVPGIDSYVGEYKSASITLSFDYGMYSGDLSDWPKTGIVQQVTINGRPAKLGTKPSGVTDFPFEIVGYFPASKATQLPNALRLSAECKTSEDVATARKIIESVQLHPERWQKPSLWRRFRRWLHI